jgi:exosome complex component RRP42
METSNLTKQRIKEYLQAGKRFDDRKFDEFRDVKIETGISKKAEGSARIHLGKTDVVVGIKMDVGTPYPDSKDSGNISVTAELIPLSSDRFEFGPPSIEAIEIARVVDRGIRESKFIDLKKLCIKEGEKVWTVYIDIYILNHDGNLIDAATMAAVAALKNSKIPKYDEEKEKVIFGEWTDKKMPLTKENLMECTVHKIGDKFLVDPTIEEEDSSDARVTIAIADGAIHAMQKGNSQELKIEEFYEIIDLAEKTIKKLSSKVK